MSISKRLEGRSDGSEKEKLMKLASETGEEEFILDLSTGLLKEFEEAVKQNPKLKFKDWYSSRRKSYVDGVKEEFSAYVKRMGGVYDID